MWIFVGKKELQGLELLDSYKFSVKTQTSNEDFLFGFKSACVVVSGGLII